MGPFVTILLIIVAVVLLLVIANIKIVPQAKAFVVEEKRKMVFLNREKFANCDQSVWDDHILNGKLEEYTKDFHMDGDYLNKLAVKSDEGAWKQSKLEKVKQYILNQL